MVDMLISSYRVLKCQNLPCGSSWICLAEWRLQEYQYSMISPSYRASIFSFPMNSLTWDKWNHITKRILHSMLSRTDRNIVLNVNYKAMSENDRQYGNAVEISCWVWFWTDICYRSIRNQRLWGLDRGGVILTRISWWLLFWTEGRFEVFSAEVVSIDWGCVDIAIIPCRISYCILRWNWVAKWVLQKMISTG